MDIEKIQCSEVYFERIATSQKRETCSREFEQKTLHLVETRGLSIAQIEQDLGFPKSIVHNWNRLLARDGEKAFPGKGRLRSEDELIRKREKQILRQGGHLELVQPSDHGLGHGAANDQGADAKCSRYDHPPASARLLPRPSLGSRQPAHL